MDYFTVTLDIDGDESRPKITELRLLGSAKSDEEKFWQRFRKQAEGQVPKDINEIHAKIREQLPKRLKDELVKKLRILLSIPETEPIAVSRPTHAEPTEPPIAVAQPQDVPVDAEWPAPGSEDTELGVLMEPEVSHGETEVYAGVQA
jgi:hypothetical protein